MNVFLEINTEVYGVYKTKNPLTHCNELTGYKKVKPLTFYIQNQSKATFSSGLMIGGNKDG